MSYVFNQLSAEIVIHKSISEKTSKFPVYSELNKFNKNLFYYKQNNTC